MLLKKIFFILISINQVGWAQDDWAQKIKSAFGKQKDWLKVRTFSYRLTRYDEQGVLISEADYILNFMEQSIQEKKVLKKDTIINIVKAGQGFQIKQQIQFALPEEDINRLSATLYYNFFNLFTRKNITFEFLQEYDYQGVRSILIRINDLEKKQSDLDIWIDKQSHLVLTSSTLEDGKYRYFANESDYQKIYKSLKFPLIFEIIQDDKKIRKGVFSNCRVN